MVYDYFIIQPIQALTAGGQGFAYRDIFPDPTLAVLSRQVHNETWDATCPKRLREPLVLYIMNRRIDTYKVWEVIDMVCGFDRAKLRKKADQDVATVPVAK